MTSLSKRVIAVDLDATLARYSSWVHHTDIGKPIPLMVLRVQEWLTLGHSVVIFTARMSVDDPVVRAEIKTAVEDWCKLHIGQVLQVSATKHLSFSEIHDDRAISVVPNTGMTTVDFIIQKFAERLPQSYPLHILKEIVTEFNLR